MRVEAKGERTNNVTSCACQLLECGEGVEEEG